METNLLKLPKLLSPKVVAEYLGVAEQTLAGWRCYGKGPAYVKNGGKVKYRLEDVEKYVNQNRKGDFSNEKW